MAYACMSSIGILNAEKLSSEEWESLKRRQKALALRMPCCNSPAGMRGGHHMQKCAHFFHLKGDDKERCATSSPESPEHRKAKSIIRSAAIRAGWKAEIEFWGQATETQFFRADVLAWNGERRIAFEVQLSPQSDLESDRREHLFREAGIESFWFFAQPSLPPRLQCANIDVKTDDTRIAFEIRSKEGLSWTLKDFIFQWLSGSCNAELTEYCATKQQAHQTALSKGWDTNLIPWESRLPSDPKYWRSSLVVSRPSLSLIIEVQLPDNTTASVATAQQKEIISLGKGAILSPRDGLFELICMWGSRTETSQRLLSLPEIFQRHLQATFLSNWTKPTKIPSPITTKDNGFGEADPFPKYARARIYAYTIPCINCGDIVVLIEGVTLGWGFETQMNARAFGDLFWEIFPPRILLPIVGYPHKTYFNRCSACEANQPALQDHPNKNEAEKQIIGNFQSQIHTRWFRHPVMVSRKIQPGLVKPDPSFFHIE